MGISEHDSKYTQGGKAYQQYTEEELAWWVRLLKKRADMRTEPAKREKDLSDAANYQAMLEELLSQ